MTIGTISTRWASTAVFQVGVRPSAERKTSSAKPEHRLREEDRHEDQFLVGRAAAPFEAGEGERAEHGEDDGEDRDATRRS